LTQPLGAEPVTLAVSLSSLPTYPDTADIFVVVACFTTAWVVAVDANAAGAAIAAAPATAAVVTPIINTRAALRRAAFPAVLCGRLRSMLLKPPPVTTRHWANAGDYA
jgi:hypothetical protein